MEKQTLEPKPPPRQLPWQRKFLFTAIVLVLMLGLTEGALRLFISPSPEYRRDIEKAMTRAERLFPAGKTATYDTTGLYEGASKATLRVSPNRFMEPEPRFPARYRVLFLGGSTTEALYVPENDRWVALLNEPPYLAAYNAGHSGANTIDEYFTLLYLTDRKGLKFDLVVLMTAANDFGWQKQLADCGRRLEIPGYQDHLAAWYAAQYSGKPRGLGERLEDNSRLAYLINRKLISKFKHRPTLLERYQQDRDEVFRKHPGGTIDLEAHARYQQDLRDYAENARRNLGVIAEAARSRGAGLLVLSEAACYGAPGESFLADLRRPLEYAEGLPDLAQMRRHVERINALCLAAARRSGAETYDLAAGLDGLVNGPRGGKYMYDSMHLTPSGCHEAARLLRPVLHQALETRLPASSTILSTAPGGP